MRLAPTLLSVVLLAGLSPSPAGAVNPSGALSDYLLTTWGRRDGLLSTFIRGIVQTTDGYIWLATTDGVFRFDGVRFVQWRARAGDVRLLGIVNTVYAAGDGGLWVGTESGVFGRIHGERLQVIDIGEPVLGILEGRNGDAWLATRDRVLHVRADHPLDVANETRLGTPLVSGPVQTADDAIWVSTETAIVRVDTGAETPPVIRAGRFWLTSGGHGEAAPTDISRLRTLAVVCGPTRRECSYHWTIAVQRRSGCVAARVHTTLPQWQSTSPMRSGCATAHAGCSAGQTATSTICRSNPP